ncbi:MAG: terminase small subunit [Patescibacteria group bacterium]|nr:terminase small subunit [Patescibacteria group bacterium]
MSTTALSPLPGVTAQQARFVQEYLVDLNGKQAAIRAGYAVRSAEVTASRLLSNHKVRDAIARAETERMERVKISQDDVIAGLHHEATFRGEGSTHGARVQAWGLLGRHLGMFTDKLDVSVTVQTLAARLAQARGRVIDVE